MGHVMRFPARRINGEELLGACMTLYTGHVFKMQQEGNKR